MVPIFPSLCYIFAAHELSKQQRKNFGEDITSAVRYAKKKVKIVLINIYPEKLVYVATAELKSTNISYVHIIYTYGDPLPNHQI